MYYTINTCAGVMELVDVVDSKSTGGDTVPVRARPPAPLNPRPLWGRGFNLFWEGGLEPISMQMSGGHLLPPVQKLVASSIFAKGKNGSRARPPASAPRNYTLNIQCRWSPAKDQDWTYIPAGSYSNTLLLQKPFRQIRTVYSSHKPLNLDASFLPFDKYSAHSIHGIACAGQMHNVAESTYKCYMYYGSSEITPTLSLT